MKLTVLLLFLGISPLFAQDFTLGYRYLETGKFSDAAYFFKEYLSQGDSLNRTALLCYGRGLGLSGQPKEATRIFEKLHERFPADLEIRLNLYEALMWNKQYDLAAKSYDNLVRKNPKNPLALLGYANALSSLGKYRDAITISDRAREVSPQDNFIKITRKYARLGLANELVSRKTQLPEAVSLLNAVLYDFPNDPDATFLKAHALSLQNDYQRAEELLSSLTGTHKQTDALLRRSYLNFIQNKPKTALELSRRAVQTAPNSEKQKASLGEVDALGWNRKFKSAQTLLGGMKNINQQVRAVSEARLASSQKKYGNASELYEQLLTKDFRSFDANMGLADAQHALGMDKDAINSLNKTLGYYPAHIETSRFLDQIKLLHAPKIGGHFFTSNDNGGNKSINTQLSGSADLQPQLRLRAGYRWREVTNGNSAAQLQGFAFGGKWQPFSFLKIDGEYGLFRQSGKNQISNENTHLISTEWRLGGLQKLTLKHQKELEVFTGELIKNQISYQHLVAEYLLATPYRVGLFGQAMRSPMSDGNQRDLIFGSVFYDFSYIPVLKVGFNAQYLAFQKSIPELYFSPKKYAGYEGFVQVENLEIPKQSILYQAVIAAGMQQFDTQKAQGTYRVLLSLGYRYKEKAEILGYFTKSNIATSTAAGFAYTEIGVKGHWKLFFR